MFGRCKRSLSATARDKGDGLDLYHRRLCASEATYARKRLGPTIRGRLRCGDCGRCSQRQCAEAGHSCIFMSRQGIAILFRGRAWRILGPSSDGPRALLARFL